MGYVCSVSGDGDYIYTEGIEDNMKKLHLYKIYTPQDIAKFILRKEEDIINLLEEKKIIGKKIMGYWYVRGKEIIEIQKLMKEVGKDVKAKAGGPVVGRKNGRRITEE